MVTTLFQEIFTISTNWLKVAKVLSFWEQTRRKVCQFLKVYQFFSCRKTAKTLSLLKDVFLITNLGKWEIILNNSW